MTITFCCGFELALGASPPQAPPRITRPEQTTTNGTREGITQAPRRIVSGFGRRDQHARNHNLVPGANAHSNASTSRYSNSTNERLLSGAQESRLWRTKRFSRANP